VRVLLLAQSGSADDSTNGYRSWLEAALAIRI
jgi:hypothetical protein